MRRPPSSIRKGTTPTLRLVPRAPMSAPEAVVRSAEGDVLGTPTATPSSVSTTVAADAANTRSRFALTSATGVARGLTLQVTDPTWGAATAVVSGLEGSSVRLVQPLPAEPSTGATVVGVDVLVQLPSSATEDLGKALVLEVTDGDQAVRHVFDVVMFPIEGPCRAQDIRTTMARKQAQIPLDEQECEDTAHAVNREIRAELMGSHVYLTAYWDPQALEDVLPPYIDLALEQRHGLRDATLSPEAYRANRQAEADRLIGRLRRSVEPYDTDGDGALTTAEAAPSASVRMNR